MVRDLVDIFANEELPYRPECDTCPHYDASSTDLCELGICIYPNDRDAYNETEENIEEFKKGR